MFCFKCGKRLPARVVNCPDCDTPQKRRLRYRRRMILGLFIFLAGAISGSLFDTVFFQGKAWNHSFLGFFATRPSIAGLDQPTVVSETATESALLPLTVVYDQPLASSASPVPVAELNGLATESASIAPASLPEIVTELNAASSSPVIASEAELVASFSEAPIAPAADAVIATETVFPEGRLRFSACEPLVKGEGSNYHGFMARDGKELIFSSNRSKVNGDNIYQCFSRKTDPAVSTERVFEWQGNVWTPELTADSAKIVFSSDSIKPEHIFVYDRASKKAEALTKGDSKNMMPAISPDGRLVAFVSNSKGGNHIWLVGIDGSNLLQLTSGKVEDREPRWTSDGRALLFTRIHQPLKKSHIMKIQLDPVGEPQTVIGTEKRNWLADLSPDGTMLAYVRSESDDGSKNTLVIRDMTSGDENEIKPLGNAEYFRPVWNADCSGFVFHATLDSGRSLFFARFSREKAD